MPSMTAQRLIAEPGAGLPGLYLDLLEQSLTGMLLEDPGWVPDMTLSAGQSVGMADRALGRDWPSRAPTMVGLKRLRNLRDCMETVLTDQVPGDVIECGVWRGGAAIFMRAVLEARGDPARRVWVADSFAGLPPPDPATYPADTGDILHQITFLAVPLAEVQANFRRYGLLDHRVRFLPGFFADTLPGAPTGPLAVMRLDGDMYGSTMQCLDALHGRLSDGGFVIVDDYCLPPCAQAVHDFRARHGITAAIHDIDGTGAFWRKGS